MSEGGTICPACGKPTKNPKFCNRSCAAKFNNKQSPKRKPEGHCRVCSTPIQTTKSLCPSCAEQQLIKEQRKSQNVTVWRRPSGKLDERPIPRAYTSATLSFSTSFHGTHDLIQPSDKVDRLLDRLIAICLTLPAYLRRQHAQRHIVLLNEFREFRFEDWSTSKTQQVGEAEVSSLSRALSQWITYLLREDNHPLMASYALETVMFIEAHVEDTYHRDWRIKPIMAGGQRAREIIRFIDPSFKKDFTQKMGTIFLSCEVPQNGLIKDSSGKTILGPRAEFVSTAKRCHLSSGVYDYIHYVAEELDNLQYDLHGNFEFYGSLFVVRSETELVPISPKVFVDPPREVDQRNWFRNCVSHFESYSSGFRTPVHWIKSVIEIPHDYLWSEKATAKLLPVPEWYVEFPDDE